MNLLLKSVKILHSNGTTEKSLNDILIQNGVIQKIAVKINPDSNTEIFEGNGAMVSIGWMDMKANFRDPGHETKEDLDSGVEAAIAGGFTEVVLMPSTTPPIQSKADVEYLTNRSKGRLVTVHATGSLSVGRDGKDITEMYDMKRAGAVAFTDDKRAVADSGLLLRAMQYVKNIDSAVITFADDKSISGKGLVNEGISSTIAGLKGMPAFAEELFVNRDLKICEYTGARLHFSTISTAAAVDMIRAAKKQGLPVTAEVCAHQLFFDDTVIIDYDTNYKVKPPFRLQSDIKALKEGLKDGTIDVICSDHSPEDAEAKIVEFDFAAFGIAGIETAFATAVTAAPEIKIERIVDAFTSAPRRVLGLPIPEIKEGEKANLTIFDPTQKWTLTEDAIRSKSKNNPFINTQLTGKPLAVVNNNKFNLTNAGKRSSVGGLPA